jgi:prepilin-type N-terminal cleavage/methylation domain-containing protein
MNKQKGFTIIELIVVIAIIAVLAAIVLVNVTQYINKGKDAAIKGNLASIMTNAAVYFSDNSSEHGADFLLTTPVTSAESAITTAGGTPVHNGSATTQEWCACSPLKVTSTTVFCVDSRGVKEETVASTCAAQCPAAGACQ